MDQETNTAVETAPEKNETTEVKTLDITEVESLLAIPGADAAMTPEEKKPGIFTKDSPDLSFIDRVEEEEENEENTEESEEKEFTNSTKVEDPLDLNDAEEETTNKGGRPALDKKSLSTLANKLIEKKLILPFDEDTPLENYSLDDYIELFEVNMNEKEKAIRAETPAEFFDSLPNELQYAAKYVADGGHDLKGLFKHLAASEEIKSLNPESEDDHEVIVRSYLQATKFGDAEEIEEEIEGWREHEQLGAKAKKFKPKLDAMQQQLLEYKLQEQEQNKEKQQVAAQQYMESVYNVLEPGEINGLKLDRKTQERLYAGLTIPSYNSINGNKTNLLGHLLEKHQFVEPNHELIAEALWLLADPEDYKSKIAQRGANKSNEKNVRMLKTEEANKESFTSTTDETTTNKSSASRKKAAVSRPQGSFFRRK